MSTFLSKHPDNQLFAQPLSGGPNLNGNELLLFMGLAILPSIIKNETAAVKPLFNVFIMKSLRTTFIQLKSRYGKKLKILFIIFSIFKNK